MAKLSCKGLSTLITSRTGLYILKIPLSDVMDDFSETQEALREGQRTCKSRPEETGVTRISLKIAI